MKALGKITGGMYNAFKRVTVLQIELIGDHMKGFEDLRAHDVAVDLKRHREHKSISANGYYWALVNQLAEVNKISNARQHNLLMRRYGTYAESNGTVWYAMIPDTDDEIILEDEHNHLSPTLITRAGVNGQVIRAYKVIRNSATYDTAEFSRLLDGAISEANEVGIDTLTPKERTRLLDRYEKSK